MEDFGLTHNQVEINNALLLFIFFFYEGPMTGALTHTHIGTKMAVFYVLLSPFTIVHFL